MEAMENELKNISKHLESIEEQLRNLPELIAAVKFKFEEEYRAAQFQGRKTSDIWSIAPPNKR